MNIYILIFIECILKYRINTCFILYLNDVVNLTFIPIILNLRYFNPDLGKFQCSVRYVIVEHFETVLLLGRTVIMYFKYLAYISLLINTTKSATFPYMLVPYMSVKF